MNKTYYKTLFGLSFVMSILIIVMSTTGFRTTYINKNLNPGASNALGSIRYTDS